jgi:chemotaxis signal transduction protein
MAQLVPHRGMYVVFQAGGLRLGIPATSIHEVRSLQELSARDQALLPPEDDLAALFGLPADQSATEALVIDMKPARMLRVARVEEVADLADAPFFALPQRIRLAVQGAIRGARLHRGQLLLELAPEALVTLVRTPRPPPPSFTPPSSFSGVPERVLVFRSGERRLAAALADVSQVVPSPTVCPVPLLPAHLWGILHHERTLHVVADAAIIFGGASSRPPPLVVLIDIAGVPLAVAADRVDGIRDNLTLSAKTEVPGAWELVDREGALYLPEYGRLFEHV